MRLCHSLVYRRSRRSNSGPLDTMCGLSTTPQRLPFADFNWTSQNEICLPFGAEELITKFSQEFTRGLVFKMFGFPKRGSRIVQDHMKQRSSTKERRKTTEEFSLVCIDFTLCLVNCYHARYSWMKVFRINPEFRILRLTFHRKSASKC